MFENEPTTEEIYTRLDINPNDLPQELRNFVENADLETLFKFIGGADIPQGLKETFYLLDEESLKDALIVMLTMGASFKRQEQQRQQQEEK